MKPLSWVRCNAVRKVSTAGLCPGLAGLPQWHWAWTMPGRGGLWRRSYGRRSGLGMLLSSVHFRVRLRRTMRRGAEGTRLLDGRGALPTVNQGVYLSPGCRRLGRWLGL